jgi:signal transduction histidine kinase
MAPAWPEDQIPHLAPTLLPPRQRPHPRTPAALGLGLYLCKLVAHAHGGRLVLRHGRPGLLVEVFLPAEAPGRPA